MQIMSGLKGGTLTVFRRLESAFDRLLGRLRHHRKKVALTVYAGISAVAYGLSYLLRFEFSIPPFWVESLIATLPVLVGLRVLFSWAFRLALGRWRFVGTGDVLRLVAATTTGSACFFVLVWGFDILLTVPRSVIFIEWFITTFLTAGLWMSYRVLFEQSRHLRSDMDRVKRVLIVGAGEAGNMLAREIRRFPTGYRLVGFVDDEPTMWGSTLQGTRVLGSTEELAAIAERTAAEEIIIAVPSASPSQLRRIVEQCEPLDQPFKVLPGIAEVLEGDVSLGQLRELRIEDLLGREPITLELPEVGAKLTGKCILITGGAGSIGSELARQVALYDPGRLVLLDQAESDLYFLERELRDRHPELDLVAVIGNVLDARCLRSLFEKHHPQRVFHAAAYKHVPLMESNVRQAFRNNVLGTWQVARGAGRAGAEGFTLISTDKAVEPTSVMGATKRVAERACMACNQVFPDTSYVAVRFGNVLGSQGSVIPLFQRQLEEGRPLTVTDPRVTRYFMTISEAVQLVLQASVLPEAQGQIAMLDMGEPVRIVDLARNLIRLTGRKSTSGGQIKFIGLRPGEKLHEKLTGREETTVSTEIEKVHIVRGKGTSSAESWVAARLKELEARDVQSDEKLRSTLFVLARGDGPLTPTSGVSNSSSVRQADD